MTFNAGSIEATLDLDRTPFQQGLRAAKQEARDFTSERYTATINVKADTAGARAEIERLQRGLDRRVKIDVDANTRGAEANIARLRTELRSLDRQIATSGDTAAASFHPLIDAVAILGPSLVPLASGLAGISSSVVGIGSVLALGFKGAANEIKAGTAEGRKFATGLATLKTGLTSLEATAARGILKPFETSVDQITAKMPQLNAFIAQTSGVVGSIAGHGISTLLNLLTAAEPLIATAEQGVDSLLSRLDDWSGSQGAIDFFNTLADDIPLAVDAVSNLAELFGKLVAAVAPVGTTVLGVIDGLTGALDLIPLPVLTAVVTGIVAWRVAAVLSAAATTLMAKAGMQAAGAASAETIALRAQTAAALQAAEAMQALAAANGLAGVSGAGAAGAGLLPVATRGRFLPGAPGGLGPAAARAGAPIAGAAEGAVAGGLIARALPAIIRGGIGLIVAGLAAGAASRATKGWQDSANPLQSGAHMGADIAKDILTLHWAFGSVRSDMDAIDRRKAHDRTQGGINRALDLSPGALASFPSGAATHNARVIGTMTSGQGGLFGQTDPAKIASQNDEITASIEKRREAEAALFDTSKGSFTLANNLKVSEAAYNEELKKTGGNIVATNSYFQAHKQAMTDDAAALDNLGQRTALYNTFLTDSGMKYKLTATQASVYATALGLTYGQITASAGAETAASTALGAVSDAFTNGNSAMQGWLTAISQVDLSTDTLTQRVAILGAGLTALRGTTLSMAGSNLSAVSAVEAAANAIEANSASVGKNGRLLGQLTRTAHGWMVTQPKLTKGSLEIQGAMAGAAEQAVQLAQAIYQNTGSATLAFSAYKGLRTQFYNTEVQSGKTKAAAHALTNEIFGVPKDASTFVKLLNKDNVSAAIADLTSKLGDFGKIVASALARLDTGGFDADYYRVRNEILGLDGSTATVTINTVHNLTSTTRSQVPGGARGHPVLHAGGGFIDEGTGPTADDVWIRVSRGEYVVNAEQTSKHYSLIDAINRGHEGFATGGTPSLITSGGGGGGSSSSGSHTGSGGRATAAAAAKPKAPTAAQKAFTANQSSLLSLLATDASGLNALVSANLASVKHVLADLARDVAKVYKQGFTNHNEVARFKRESDALIVEVGRREDVAKRLANARADLISTNQAAAQERQAVRGTIMGTFDPGTAGNGYQYGILASITKDAADATKFEGLRKKAKALGLDPRLLKTITEEGPQQAGANLAAIVAGGKSFVGKLNKQEGVLSGVANRVAAAQATDTYAKRQADDTRKIHTLAHQQTTIQTHIRNDVKKLKDEMTALRRDVKNKKKTA